jgi:hypothetical protein
MEANNISVDANLQIKSDVCKKCITSSKVLDITGGARTKNLPSPSDYERSKIFDLLASINYDRLTDFEFMGICVGRIALYETLIRFKKVDLVLNSSEKVYFKIKVAQVMEMVAISFSVLKKENPDVVVCYSPQYSITGAFSAVCKQKGIRVIFMEGSGNISERESHLRLWDWETYGLTQPAMFHLEQFHKFSLTPKRKLRAQIQLSKITSGDSYSVYSPKKIGISIFDYFGFDRTKKLLLLSMSSYDEVYSAFILGAFPQEKYLGKVYENQVEWVQKTILWATKNNIQLVIRPHPREFPNKRESFTAQHTDQWSEVLKNLPDCVRIDHPEMGLSIYDHFREIDAITTGWSFTGIEAMCEGIPLVTYDNRLPSYPSEIHFSGTDETTYQENLSKALLMGRSHEIQNNGLRWLAFLAEKGTIEILSPKAQFLGKMVKISSNLFYIDLALRVLRRLARALIVFLPPSKRDLARIELLLKGDSKDLFD